MKLESLKAFIKRLWRSYDRGTREKLIAATEYETEELEHVFALLVLGQFIGLPMAPLHIGLELLPEMEDQLRLMLEKEDTAAAPLSDLASLFEVS